MSIYGVPLCAMLALSHVISVGRHGSPTEEDSKFDGEHLAFLATSLSCQRRLRSDWPVQRKNWFNQIAETWGLDQTP